MAEPLTPAGVKVQGAYRTIWCPSGSSLTAPSLAVMTGVSALEVTNIFYADSARYQKETNTGAAPRRQGTKKVWQQFGTSNESYSGALRYVIDPQAAAASDGKKAYEKFPDGTAGVHYVLPGIDTEATLAVGDFVIPIPVKYGARYIDGDPTDEFAEFSVVQSVIVTAPGAGELVAIVA